MKKKTEKIGLKQPQNINTTGFEHYISGMHAYIENQMELAISCLIKAVEINSDIPEAYYILGKLFFKNGEVTRACKIFRDLLLRSNLPEDLLYRTKNTLIDAYSDCNQFYKAQKIAAIQVKKYPYDSQILQTLITLLEKQNKFKQAEKYLKNYCRYLKMSPNPRLALYHVETAKKIGGKSTSEKVRILNKAIKIFPGCGPAYVELAKIFQSMNKDRKVLNLWQKLLKNAPQSFPMIIKDVSNYLFKINRYNELLQIFQSLSRIKGPHRDVVQAELTLHYLKIGSTEQARQTLSEMLKEEETIPEIFKEMLFAYLKDERNDAVIESLQKKITSFKNISRFTCLECGKTSIKILWHCPDCGAWESYSLIKD